MSTSFIGLGYCGWDHLCVLPKIPQDDKVKIEERLEQGGGPAATATYAAARLGLSCAFWGAVGDDAQGGQIIAALTDIGVDASAVRRRAGCSSPIAYCWVESDSGKRSIAWTSGAVSPLAPSELPLAQLAQAKVLHLDGHQTEAAIVAARFAREHGILVSLDAGTVLPGIETLLELADIVISSEKFAQQLCPGATPTEAARHFFAMGTTHFAGVTLGNRGSVGYDGQKEYFQAIFPLPVRDTTGAGDVFHGAFAATAVKLGADWQECMRQASMTAAIKCGKLGGRSGIPDAAELEQALVKQA
jgi:sugar/nucleoside kinase (ribokinase family)